MASNDEYKAVYGTEPPPDKTAATEFGDGGCNVIYKKSLVVGRWRSYEEASKALGGLQTLGGRFEYSLEPSHHWVTVGGLTKCQTCGATRTLATMSGLEWP